MEINIIIFHEFYDPYFEIRFAQVFFFSFSDKILLPLFDYLELSGSSKSGPKQLVTKLSTCIVLKVGICQIFLCYKINF